MKKSRKKTIILPKKIILEKKPANKKVLFETNQANDKSEKIFISPLLRETVSPLVQIKNLEDLLPAFEQRIVQQGLDATIPTQETPTTTNNFNAYDVRKNNERSYSMNNDYFSSKSYDMNVQSPDGGSAAFKGSDFFEKEDTMKQKQYDSEKDQREKNKRF